MPEPVSDGDQNVELKNVYTEAGFELDTQEQTLKMLALLGESDQRVHYICVVELYKLGNRTALLIWCRKLFQEPGIKGNSYATL
ncbi:hypothetical protein scyTo_0002877 [Scyliorhinus torazame]|uniref:Uncharacterized protein n=1 Tax=Scyliorhinus torazame TaxID=75743 RepID=A0A401PL13_SCYTO|nr:hypothetical protein [Scyliorhinus torazame]